METLSSILLIICSLFAAVLPYRQPQKLSDNAKPLASLSALCALFIALSAIISLVFSGDSDDTQAVILIFDNLATYLAIPLLSFLIISAYCKRYFSKGTWGRVSLALLALFEICRRAEVGEIYSVVVASLSFISIAICLLLWLKQNRQLWLINLGTITCFGLANIVFSQTAETQYQNINAFNLLLAIALIGITFNMATAIKSIHSQ